jgi:hypothetical protein
MWKMDQQVADFCTFNLKPRPTWVPWTSPGLPYGAVPAPRDRSVLGGGSGLPDRGQARPGGGPAAPGGRPAAPEVTRPASRIEPKPVLGGTGRARRPAGRVTGRLRSENDQVNSTSDRKTTKSGGIFVRPTGFLTVHVQKPPRRNFCFGVNICALPEGPAMVYGYMKGSEVVADEKLNGVLGGVARPLDPRRIAP